MRILRYRLAFVSWLFTALAFLAALHSWSYPSFGTDDDPIMLLIISGAYTGQPEAGVLFIHPLLSSLLVYFYKIQPNSYAYILQYIAAQAFILATCSNILWNKRGQTGLFYTSLLMIGFWIISSFFCIRLQFTTTAFMLVGTGFLLLLRQLESSDRLRNYSIIAFLLWGYLLRPEVLLPAGILISPFLLAHWKKRIIWFWAVGIVASLLLLNLSRQIYYQASPDWAHYEDYRPLQANLTKYDNPAAAHLDTSLILQQQPDIDVAVLPLLTRHAIPTERLQLPMLKAWQAALPNPWSFANPMQIVDDIRGPYLHYSILLGLLLIFLLFPKPKLAALFATGIFLILFSYLSLFAVAKYRVVWGLLWILLLFVFYHQDYPQTILRKVSLVLLVVAFSAKYFRSVQFEHKISQAHRQDWTQCWKQLDSDQVYIWIGGQLNIRHTSPWVLRKVHEGKKVILSGSLSGSPLVTKQLEQYLNYTSPLPIPPLFEEVLPLYSKQVMLLGNSPEVLKGYIRRNGGLLKEEPGNVCTTWRWQKR